MQELTLGQYVYFALRYEGLKPDINFVKLFDLTDVCIRKHGRLKMSNGFVARCQREHPEAFYEDAADTLLFNRAA